MYARHLIGVVGLFFVGCAARLPYGNFVAAERLDFDALAQDASHVLSHSMLPAKTHLRITAAAGDAFGKALDARLRQRGFAIVAEVDEADDAPLLHYVVDRANEPNLYRVTLALETATWARPYRYKEGVFEPAGLWTHRE